MSAFASGEALPQLADVVARATLVPFLGTLWLGPRTGVWVLVGTLLWHFSIILPMQGLTDYNKDHHYFTNVQASSDAVLWGYMIALPVLALLFTVIGAINNRFLPIPRHLLPFGHLFESRPKAAGDKALRTYALVMFIMAVLIIAGAWLPYELLVAYLGGDDWSVAIVGCVVPAALTLLLPTIPIAVCSDKAHVWDADRYSGKTHTRTHHACTAGRYFTSIGFLLLAVVMASVPTVLVAFFVRDFDWTWMTAALAGLALLFLPLFTSFVCRIDPVADADVDTEEEEEEEEAASITTMPTQRMRDMRKNTLIRV
jgi:hypothetical protein